MRYLFPVLFLSFSLAACAEEPPADAPEIAPPDPAIVALLEELEYEYEIDADGDFRLLFDFEDGRSQLVWIRNRTYERDGVAMRDIWSVAVELTGRYASVKLADALLRGSYDTVMGNWARDGSHIVYMVKVPAVPDKKELDAALGEAIEVADELEKDQSFEDVF